MLKIKELLKGSPVAMVVAGLVIAGVASAALVTYLANDVVVDNTVASPIKMNLNLGDSCDENDNTYLYFSSFGGDDYTYSTVSKNQSNNAITGYNVIVNEQTDGGMLTGKECTDVIVDGTYHVLDDIYVVHSDGTLEQLISKTWNNKKLVTTICYPGYPGCGDCTTVDEACQSIINSGDTECIRTTLVLHPANKGTYRFTGQFVDDLAKYAAEEYAK